MKTQQKKEKHGSVVFRCFVCLCLLALSPMYLSSPVQAEEVKAAELAAPKIDPEKLWQDALDLQKEGKLAKAKRKFKKFYDTFRDDEKGQEALWQAAQAAKALAETEEDPRWEEVRNLFRMFTTDFPEADRAPEAYFEVGKAHYHMRFFREALIYFKLFAQRYPDSPLVNNAKFWQGTTLFVVGRLDEAAKVFRAVAEVADQDLMVKAMMGLGDTQTANKKYAAALATFATLTRKFPNYYLGDPELYRKLGAAYMKMGNFKKGRKYLYHYLNLAENSRYQNEVLFEVAESYFRQDAEKTALKLYEKIIDAGRPKERAVVLSKFRLAEYLDDPERILPKWQKRGDLTKPAGDRPYLDVLDKYYKEFIAQDARRGLFLRYKAREKFEYAYETGKSYLRYDAPGLQKYEKPGFTEKVLIYIAEGLLAQEEYEKLYQIYKAEHRHVKPLEGGRFLYLVGQALEALSLFDQAAVVYYRALALPLSEEDKVDLYYRRAEVYLLKNDLVAAGRLLRYMRKIYKGSARAAEALYLSGRLSEEQGKPQEAMGYYDKAIKLMPIPERRSDYGQGRLRTLFSLKRYDDVLAALSIYRDEEWLSPEDLQAWYMRVGDVLRRQEATRTTVEAYLAAVSEKMPQEGEAVQHIHLQLGALYNKLGDTEKSRSHLWKAKDGPNELLTKRARERLNQVDIEDNLTILNIEDGS